MRYSILVILLSASACAQDKKTESSLPVGGYCDGCNLIYEGMPKVINEEDTSAGWKMAGQKLLAHGVVYKPDGKTPASGIVVYYHHTDNDGHYSLSEGQKFGRRHGQLRGWVKTNNKGEYKIYTIKPAPYPGRNIPAHIHLMIKEANINEYSVDDIWFDGDPFITASQRMKLEGRGGNGIVQIKEIKGLLVVNRDIVLGKNIPNYPE